MSTDGVIQYLDDLELALPKSNLLSEFGSFKARGALESGEEGQEESFIVNKSITSFASGVTGQNRQDVLNSTLLSQLAADKKYPDGDDLAGWFTDYTNTLKKIGWVLEDDIKNTFETKDSILEVEKAFLEILTTMVVGNQVAVMLKTLDAIKNLGKEDKRIIAFEKNTHVLNRSQFQLGVATEKDEAVSLSISSFSFEATKNIRQILFFRSKSETVSFNFNRLQMTLHSQLYGNFRNKILAKLSDKVDDFIGDLEI